MSGAGPRQRPRGTRALEALNFTMADVQDGLGPFLSVFLQSKGWSLGAIGSVMTAGGIVGMLATTPGGALVDATKRKRSIVVVGCSMILLASALLWWSPTLPGVIAAQVMTALAAAALGPALSGITLGLVRQAGFDHQIARNQVGSHAGNVVAAALAGVLGWKFGFGAVFVLTGCFGVLAIVSVLLIPRDAIDHRAARGMAEKEDADGAHVSGWSVLADLQTLAGAGRGAGAVSSRQCGDAAAVRHGGGGRAPGRSERADRHYHHRRPGHHGAGLAAGDAPDPRARALVGPAADLPGAAAARG